MQTELAKDREEKTNNNEQVGPTFNDAESMMTHSLHALDSRGFMARNVHQGHKFTTQKAKKFEFKKLELSESTSLISHIF